MIAALLVEDSATIREVLIPTLSDLAGVEVVAFVEGEREAVEWLRSLGPSVALVILDLFLKQGSGLGVLSRRAELGLRKVVVLTNYATAEMRRRCMELGADAFFDKSSELDQFLDYARAAAPGRPHQ